MRQFVHIRSAATLVLALTLVACDQFDSLKEGYAHSQAVSAALEKSVGLKSFVGFNWRNGVLTTVTVTFQGVPTTATLAAVVDSSKKAVLAEFKQTPQEIVVAFAIEP